MVIGLADPKAAVGHGGSGGGGHGSSAHGSRSDHRRPHGRGWPGGPAGGRWFGGDRGGWTIPGHGFYFSSLPTYCKLLYWEGVPYYYADEVYYEWSGSAGGYEEVQPPAPLAAQMAGQAPVVTELFVFPIENQTSEQLQRDREACTRWAAQQVGFDPKAAAPRKNALDPSALQRAAYLRADAACLGARHYAVE